MKQPKNQLAEVLYLLLEGDKTSLEIIKNGVLNPTSKVSQLRSRGVSILCYNVQHTNKFGRKMKYGRFTVTNYLPSVKIYNQINK
jgi:hypothetical protein